MKKKKVKKKIKKLKKKKKVRPDNGERPAVPAQIYTPPVSPQVRMEEVDAVRSYMRKSILRGMHIKERGRDLDKIVAQEVFGWTVIPPFKDQIPQCHDPKTGIRALPLFSTSNLAVMDLYMELRKGGDFCCIDISSDYDYCFDVKVKLANDILCPRNPAHIPEVVVTRESLPLAMSLAAVEAVRYVKKLKEANDAIRNQLRGETTDQFHDRIAATPTTPRPTAC
jgi:hypothetical protein